MKCANLSWKQLISKMEKRIMASEKQIAFYREWIMARDKFDPRDFGINMSKDEYTDQLIEECSQFTRGQLTIDELLLRPSLALEFVYHIRRKYGYFDVPEDIILRPIMNKRKASKK